ncbi:MAG: 1,2-phenylacetyl-CoA epoxidase subunit PaaE [Chitinophagaceae bacterium]
MSTKFYPLRVKKINRETNDCVSLSFDIPDDLKELFRYKQGQYLTLRTHIGDEEVRRSYSLCSSPLDAHWRVAVKKVPGGLFSGYANEVLKPGDIVEVMPPNGRFFQELDALQQKNYMALASGSGITPVLSIIETTLRTEPQSSFTLVYGNRNRNSIIFKEELEALKNQFIDRFRIYHVLSREKTDAPLNYGRIDAEKCAYIFSKLVDMNTIDAFFLCGPEEMIFGVKDWLESQLVDRHKIHFELFTSPIKNAAKHMAVTTNVDHGPESRITVKLDGIEQSFNLAYDGEPILDAALHEGADLPYACKGGVCCTCRARLTEGEVFMDANYGLEPDELAAGFILTCQSHPRTAVVKIDFDAV